MTGTALGGFVAGAATILVGLAALVWGMLWAERTERRWDEEERED